MKVQRLVLDPGTNSPIIILEDEGSGSLLPIWIGIFEAHAIAMRMEGVQPPRPMTHDLLGNTIKVMDGAVERIEVVDLVDNTYFARIYFHVRNEQFSLDSRPSDAIALALRVPSPIFVADHVLEKSKIDPADFKFTSVEPTDLGDSEILDPTEEGFDEDEYTQILKNFERPDKDKLN